LGLGRMKSRFWFDSGRVRFLTGASLIWLAFFSVSGTAQPRHAGRGAMSAQQIAGMAAPPTGGDAHADRVCARFAAGATVATPPELKSANGLLELTLRFLTVVDSRGLRRYCYVTETGLESPTLRVNPGDKLIIHFKNELPPATDADESMTGTKMTMGPDAGADAEKGTGTNVCHGTMSAAATNLHFHGTNVAPVCGQDEVLHTLLEPGQSFDYKVQIPANEPPGLYWYHPHPHGYSEAQVQGGASGALIVEGLEEVDPWLAGLPERTLLIRDQLLPNSESNDPNIPAWDLSINFVPVTYPSYAPAVMQTVPQRRELWRVANITADTILNLEYVVDRVAQAVEVVAVDGYPIESGNSGKRWMSETSLLLPPGARAEFVVTTPRVGENGQLVTQRWNTGPDGDSDPARMIARIVSGNLTEGQANSSLGFTTSRAGKATRFAGLATAPPAALRTLYFSEVLQDRNNPAGPTNFFITEVGQAPEVFSAGQKPNIMVRSGTVEDWVVENRAQEDHIFHIHQIHFQVLAVDGKPVDDPALRDSVDVPYWTGSGPYPSVKLRMDFRDPNIVGTFVYHCHILGHEDGGMMGELEVLPAESRRRR